MKTALVTGASGFVGSHLIEYLLQHTDWNIVGMIRWRSPLDNMQSFLNSPRVRFVYADLLDTISIQNAIKDALPDYVYHLAAQSYPKTSFTDPLTTLDTNVQGTVRLLDALKNFSPEALICICSSSEIFGRVPKDKLPITEDCSLHPASPYAISKAGTDLVGRFYAEAYGMHIQVVRLFTHTGPRRGDVFAESSFAKQIAMIEAEQIEPVVKVGNLDSLRTFADVRDAVRAYYMLLTVKPTVGAYYNIGGDHTCTIGDMLQYLLSLSSKKLSIFVVQDKERLRPIDADLQIPCTAKFQKHTGWKPEIPFTKTIQDLLEYWRNKVRNTQCLTR